MMVGRFGNGGEDDEDAVGRRKRGGERKKKRKGKGDIWVMTDIYCTHIHHKAVGY